MVYRQGEDAWCCESLALVMQLVSGEAGIRSQGFLILDFLLGSTSA